MEQGRLVYIAVPEEKLSPFLREQHHTSTPPDGRAFAVVPSIPLPLELPPGAETFDPETLSAEMLLSGLLRELAAVPGREYADYYRALVLALRPGITGELTGAAIIKSKNGDHDTALEILNLLTGLYPRNGKDGGALPLILFNKALILEARACARAGPLAWYKPEGSEDARRDDLRGAKVAGFAEAEAAWEEALAAPLPDTLFYAGLFYYRQGEYRRAAELFSVYLEDEGCASSAEKRAQAKKFLDEIENKGLDDSAFLEACALIRSGAEEKGILLARDFLEREPQSSRGWFALGWGLRRLSRWEDAAACFGKAIEYGLDNADTRNELAICHIETGAYDKARRELEHALRDEPENSKIISNLGVVALRQGRNDEAASFFRTALELDGNDPVALSFSQ